jgi:beta-glucosidase
VTLFHWDYPYELQCRGGWLNRESADWFADYAKVIVDKLSDRVGHWMTQNEPQCYLANGHFSGELAPGFKLSEPDVLRAIHHSLLAHGKAVQVIRARAKRRPLIGAAPVGVVKVPASSSRADIEAARARTFSVPAPDFWNNTWYADPMIFGKYPEDGLKLHERHMPKIQSGDLKTICQKLDFYGANIYQGGVFRAKKGGGAQVAPLDIGPALTTMTWRVVPESLYWGPRFYYERYKLPIVITENGMANCDWVHVDGRVRDPQRIDFLTRYLRAYKRAIDDGVPCKGYFQWSIMDNFEWCHGYKQRFGLIYIDYKTQRRILKDSAYWYKQVIATNGASIGK